MWYPVVLLLNSGCHRIYVKLYHIHVCHISVVLICSSARVLAIGSIELYQGLVKPT